jgi:hypothetical protein
MAYASFPEAARPITRLQRRDKSLSGCNNGAPRARTITANREHDMRRGIAMTFLATFLAKGVWAAEPVDEASLYKQQATPPQLRVISTDGKLEPMPLRIGASCGTSSA